MSEIGQFFVPLLVLFKRQPSKIQSSTFEPFLGFSSSSFSFLEVDGWWLTIRNCINLTPSKVIIFSKGKKRGLKRGSFIRILKNYHRQHRRPSTINRVLYIGNYVCPLRGWWSLTIFDHKGFMKFTKERNNDKKIKRFF